MASSDPRSDSVERLLAERAWVRRLAVRLVRDPGEAEDLACLLARLEGHAGLPPYGRGD